jgi:tetratricopeptide (TPR) repeat protein
MIRALFGHRSLVIGALALGLAVFLAPPAAAQTGQVKGKVVDGQGQPLEGAAILIEYVGALSRRHETKTNKKGEFVQIGLQSGTYKVTAAKDKMSQSFEVRVRLGVMSEVNFVLTAGTVAPMSKEDMAAAKAKIEAATKLFDEGVVLSQADKDPEAIAKFNEVIGQIPQCGECYVNIGAIHAKNKRYDEAEAAFKKGLEINPGLVDGYNGLANVYNAQKKFDEAAKMSQEASKMAGAGGGGASSIFNEGIILWNSGKIPEAKQHFEEAIAADPNLAEAHYWHAMALVNEGKLPDAVGGFEKYLELAPTGQYAEQAKGILKQIKK